MAMQAVTRELERVRRRGRGLLVLQRVLQAAAVLLPLALMLGLVDFGLRLPGVVRLVVGVMVLGVAGVWLVSHVGRAMRFGPSLSELAQRAERLFPQLAGSLATAVEFHLKPELVASPAMTSELAGRSLAQAESRLQGVELGRLINPSRTKRVGVLALLGVLALGGVALVSPSAAGTAAARWLMPLGGTEWPRRQAVVDMTHTVERDVVPAHTPVSLLAIVDRGYSEGLRAELSYRFVLPGGDGGEPVYETLLLDADETAAELGLAGMYSVVVSVPASVRRALDGAREPYAVLEYRFAAGDDQTEWSTLRVAARPRVSAVWVEVEPPGYAAGLVEARRVEMSGRTDRVSTAGAYVGSSMGFEVRFNKPMPVGGLVLDKVLPGFAGVEGVALEPVFAEGDSGMAVGMTAGFVVGDEAVFTRIELVDEYGLTSSGSREYVVRPRLDRGPTVTLVEPATDEQVLATALIPVEAKSEDDIAVERLGVEVLRPVKDTVGVESGGPTVTDRGLREGEAFGDGSGVGGVHPMTGVAMEAWEQPGMMVEPMGRTAVVGFDLDFEGLGVEPGDVVLAWAATQDVYRDGEGRPRVVTETPVRRLVVITESQFDTILGARFGSMQSEVRRLSQEQRQAMKRSAEEAASMQRQIDRRLEAQRSALDATERRMDRNRYEDEDLRGMVGDARELLERASEASAQARRGLEASRAAERAAEEAQQQSEAAEQAGDVEEALRQADEAERLGDQAKAQDEAAREQQAAAEAAMRELAARLDQGGAFNQVKNTVEDLRRRQEQVARDTRQILPRTAGQPRSQLPAELQAQLEDLAERQRELAEDAQELINDAEAAARNAANQDDGSMTPEEQALAQTLQAVADTAKREGLTLNQEAASEQLEQNQPSAAGSRQQQAMDTLDAMLEQLGKRNERLTEELKRRLADLTEKVRELVQRQERLVGALDGAADDALAALGNPQFELRRRTILVEAEAMAAEQTRPVAEPLGEAILDQEKAVVGLRGGKRASAAVGQRDALVHLKAALAQLEEMQDENQDSETREKRAKLAKRYLELAAEQNQLIARVEPLSEKAVDAVDGRLNRRDQLTARRIGTDQAELRTKIVELGKEVRDESAVFASVHDRIESAAGRAANRLSREQKADGSVLRDQRAVVSGLMSMVEALNDRNPDEEWESPQQDSQGGGGGGPMPLVPPIAELRLLRDMQQDVRDATAELAGADDLTEPVRHRRLRELGREQAGLEDLAEQMIEKFKQSMQSPAAPEAREAGDGEDGGGGR
ncbi:MAG: hypothetical protein AAGI68_06850 [Planctomycetota bacterium]